jgi:uncharacterized OB-fold protein
MSEPAGIPRPVPAPEGLNAEFYARCAEGQLCFQRCTACGAWRHLPRQMCAACGSTAWEWAPSSGRGKVYTWTVTHQAMHPAFANDIPYAIVVVELEEGVRMVSALRGLPPDRLELGLPVEVELERVSDTIALPYFRPAGETAGA